MERDRYHVIEDPIWRYRRLDPIPLSEELPGFYQSHYYDLVRKGGRAPELHRIMAGGEDAKRELTWLKSTLYADILDVFESQTGDDLPRRALDVGCGTGEFVAFLKDAGWDAVGLEPSQEAAEVARKKILEVYPMALEEYERMWRLQESRPFGAISLLNVLEHVPDPVGLLNMTKRILAPGGLLAVRVPNDFNELQLAAQARSKKEPWWIAIPDHINYFEYKSLKGLLTQLAWKVLYVQADFPMELFLLMGEDYVGNSDIGKQCHEKRRLLELSIPAETRRKWYRALADAGLGRNSLIIARADEK